MHNLTGTILPELPITGLQWVSDLEYFDGPLVSHFLHERTGDVYLKCWVDCDADANRWMWVRISENDVIRLASRVESLDRVIPIRCQDDFVYFVDKRGNGESSVALISIRQIPEDYTPLAGAFLRPARSNEKTFPILINSNLEPRDLGDIPRVFTQAYSILYLLTPGHSVSRQAFLSHPWRGGFSSMHFYNEVVDVLMPEEAKLGVKKVQYSSPGFIRFSVDRPTAEMVSHCVALIMLPHSEARRAYSSLGSYIKTNELNDLRISDNAWERHNSELIRLTRHLLTSLEIDNPTELITAAPRPFEAAKIARSIFSRLSVLAKYQTDGLITLPQE